MAGNPAPTDSSKLQQALTKAANGAYLHGATLNLKHDEARLNGARQTLFDAELAYDRAEIAWRGTTGLRSHKDDEIAAYIKVFKAALVYEAGNQYGPLFQLAGFAANSTEIPDDASGRVAILTRIPGVLTANAALVNAAKGLTVARATTLNDEWNTVVGDVTSAERAMQAAQTARDDALKAARKALIGLIDELDEELKADDTIWWDFDLNRPDDPATPDAPASAPTVAATGPGTLRVSNLILPRRADAVFVRTQIVGEQSEPQSAGPRIIGETTLAGLPTGKTLRVFYCGVNADGSGPLSPAAEIVVP